MCYYIILRANAFARRYLLQKKRENKMITVSDLSFNFGRCAAAAVWAKFFTGETPAFLQRNDLSEGYRLIAEELNK